MGAQARATAEITAPATADKATMPTGVTMAQARATAATTATAAERTLTGSTLSACLAAVTGTREQRAVMVVWWFGSRPLQWKLRKSSQDISTSKPQQVRPHIQRKASHRICAANPLRRCSPKAAPLLGSLLSMEKPRYTRTSATLKKRLSSGLWKSGSDGAKSASTWMYQLHECISHL